MFEIYLHLWMHNTNNHLSNLATLKKYTFLNDSLVYVYH